MNAITWHRAVITAANTAKDGTGALNWIFGPVAEDVYFDRVVFRAAGTNVATAARVFINNGEDNANPGNNVLFTEITLPATTLSEVAALTEQSITLDIWLPAGYRAGVTIGTAVAAGYYVTAVAGLYQIPGGY